MAILHKSTEPLILPLAGVDSHVDEAVLRGEVVIVGKPFTGRDGIRRRGGRSKGVTYRRYAAVSGAKRRDHRAAAKQIRK